MSTLNLRTARRFEYRLSDRGLHLVDTYLGGSAVLTGSARLAREAEDAAIRQRDRLTADRAAMAKNRQAFSGIGRQAEKDGRR